MGFKELEEREREIPSNDDTDQEQDGDLTTVFEALDIDETESQPAAPASEKTAAPENDSAPAAPKPAAPEKTPEPVREEVPVKEPVREEPEEDVKPVRKRRIERIVPQEEEETEEEEDDEEDTTYYTSVFMRVMSLLSIIVSAVEIVGGAALAILGGGLFGNARIDRLNMSAAHAFGAAIVVIGVLTLLAGIAGRKEKKVLSVILAILLIAVMTATFFLDVSLLQVAVLAFYILYFGAVCSIQPYEEY